jgi:acetyl esterase/lipase
MIWLAWMASLLIGAGPAPERLPPYPHRAFTSEEVGTGVQSYWLFEPARPKPVRAPVIVLHHGWLAVNPGVYGAWIEHLARRGFVVIYPRYQADWATPPADYLPNALAAVHDALDVLQGAPGRVRPDRDRFAIVGHSAGGNLSALMAAVAAKQGLPRPRAVVALMPGEVRPLPGPSLSTIPRETLLVVVAGEQDWVVGDSRARQIHEEAISVPADRKLYVYYRADRYGAIAIPAGHFAPTAGLPELDTGEGPFRQLQMKAARVDILDRYGLWRLADVTLDAAFAGRTLDEATRGGALFRDLGRWGNGRAVTPPIVGNDLSVMPRVVPSNGARLLPRSPEAFIRALHDGVVRPVGLGGQGHRDDDAAGTGLLSRLLQGPE